MGEGSHNPLGGVGCGYFDSHSTKHRCRSFPQHNVRRLRGVSEAGAACRKILSHFIGGKGSKPRLQFLEYYGRFHRVSGERPRILLLVEQLSGCEVRPLRAQAHSVSACSLTVLHVFDFAGGDRGEIHRAMNDVQGGGPAKDQSSRDGGVAPKHKVPGDIAP